MVTRVTLALLLLVAATLSFVSVALADSVGNMPGRFNVSSTGSARYSIPIWTPPGIHGVQPNLALVYDSQSGSGIMGPGWSVSGLSSIYRCNPTYAQDGAPAPVTLTQSDRFCLDGNKLRLTSSESLSTYGEANTTYETELADFSRVTASSSETGNGPSYFTVQGKDGLTYEYGKATNAQILAPGNATPYIWALDKVTDRAGNYMSYTYTQSSGSFVISSIEYTAPTGSTTFLYQVQFTYGPLPAAGTKTGYIAGSQIQQTNELTSIAVQLYGTSTDLRVYKLGYTPSNTTARETLSTIQECGGSAGGDCLPPTTVGYQSGAAGVASPTTASGSGASSGEVYSVDIDGDGRQDLVFAISSGSNDEWWVQLANDTGYGAPMNTGAVTAGTADFLLDDFDAMGPTEILAPVGGVFHSYKWDGTSFTATSTGIAAVAGTLYSTIDIDGDGRPDLISATWSTSGIVNFGIRLNTTRGTAVSFAAPIARSTRISGNITDTFAMVGNNQSGRSPVKHFDFDGDGRQDLLIYYRSVDGPTTFYTLLEMLSRGTDFVVGDAPLTSSTVPQSFLVLNWNDDACTDVVFGDQLLQSECNGNGALDVKLPAAPMLALDWNGDGRTDLLANVSGAWEVYVSQGAGFAAGFSTGIPVGNGNWDVTDQNGDGLDDLVFANHASSYALSYGLHAGALTPPDLATSFTDGYGNSVRPEYATIRQGSSAWNDQVFPYQNYTGPIYIAVQTIFSDPTAIGATYQQHYYYAGASMNLQGRGFGGFGAIQTYDSRNGTWDTKEYNRSFPYAGTVKYDVLAQDNLNAEPIGISNSTWAVNTLDATPYNERYFPYASPVVVQNYEVGGTENTALISSKIRTTTYDAYGNATTVSTVTTDEDSGSPHHGDTWTSTADTTITTDTSTWCLNMPTETQVTNSSTAPGGAAITRTVTYTPDYAGCRVTGKVTAPGTSYQVSEVYGFDSFGNVNSDAVTGLGMATRTTGINWGTTGQFPTVINNALGQSITLRYDPYTGNPSSRTDPNYTTANPLQTSWTYDEFGRKTKETRPDGTYTTWAYNNCATWGGCLLGSYGLAVLHEVFAKNAALIQAGTTDYDALNRPILWNKLLLNNTYDLNEVKYDNLGRMVGQAEPCAWGGSATTLCPHWVTNQYDILNRLKQSQRPISATNGTLQTTTYGYAGRTSTIRDALGHTTTKINTVTGQLARSIDANGYYQNFTYDGFGSLTAVTDSASNALFSAKYAYGLGAFKTATSDMDMGSWGYTVDPLGEVTAHTDAKGQSFSQSYDALARPLIRTEPDLTTTWTWGASAASHNIGKLASVTAESAVGTYSDTYTYDSLGRRSTHVISNPGDRTYAYIKTYDPNTGLLASLQYPVDISFILTVQYAYKNGILQSVSSDSYAPPVVYWTANATNPRGQVTQETLGNGVVVNRNYDAVTGWLGSIQSGAGGGAGLQNNSFLYDYNGNLTQRQDNNQGLTENFYYDALDRLSYSTLGGTINLQMTYDAAGMGNIAARSDVAGGANWTYDPVRKHAVTQAGSTANTYSYDANGNAVTRNGYSIGWTSYNYPGGVSSADESVTFQYGPDRQRWQELYSGPNGVETTYRAGKLFEVAHYGGLAHYRHYVYAGNELVSIDDRTTVGQPTYYVASDHQGSIASFIGGVDSCPAGYTLSGSTCMETLSEPASANYSCPAGYTLSGSSCVDTASVPAMVNYSCPTGYSLSGTTCSETVTAAASVSYSCPSGYSLSGTECSETLSEPALYACGDGGAVSRLAPGVTPDNRCRIGYYYCPGGWTLKGVTCYQTVTQAATATYSCPAGYALSGTACSETLAQAADASYSCPAGYILAGSTCSETVPAAVSYSCPAGYSLSGSTCSDTLNVAATGSGPSVVVPESFTPYGLRRSGETWSGAPTATDESIINSVSRRGYTQQTALGISMGLNHMNGRIEDAITGRFLSPDPNTFNPGNTQNWNRYSYVNNNPLSLTDPSGFQSVRCNDKAGKSCYSTSTALDLLNGPDLYGNVGWDDSLLPGDDSGGSETTNPIAAFNQWVAQATDSTEGQDDALDPDYFSTGSLTASDANYWAGTSLTLTGLAFSVARGPNDPGFGEMLGPEGLFLAAPGLVAGVGEAATAGFEGLMGWFAGDAAEGAATLDASQILFSQSSANGVQAIARSMAADGWVGAPVDVVATDAGYVTLDNARVAAAYLTGTPVQATIWSSTDLLPASMAGRFVSSAGLDATTWGEALSIRIGSQNAAYQSLFPTGSWYIGIGAGP